MVKVYHPVELHYCLDGLGLRKTVDRFHFGRERGDTMTIDMMAQKIQGAAAKLAFAHIDEQSVSL